MFHVQQSTHYWLGVNTNRHTITDKEGNLYATVISTSKNSVPQIEIYGRSGQRSPEGIIEYAQALMEAMRIYNQLLTDLNDSSEGCTTEPRTYDDASSKNLATARNFLCDDVRKN